jgi:DNA-binding transcriptional LysR family regulator
MSMTLRHFHIFLAVCTRGTMTKAAEALEMAQPPVSQAIGEMERHYGTLLFERRGRKLILTPAGGRLQSYAAHIEALVNEARSTLRALTEEGDLRVGASKTVGTELLPEVCREFRTLFPRSALTVLVDNTATILEKLRSAELDLALVEGTVEGDQLFLEPLCDDEMVLVCPPDHRWAGKTSIPVGALEGEAFFVREPGSGTRETFESTMAARGLNWVKAGEVGGGAAIQALVAAGLGSAFLSTRTIRQALARGEVHRVEVEGLRMVRTFQLAIHESKLLSPALVSFTKAAHRVASTL